MCSASMRGAAPRALVRAACCARFRVCRTSSTRLTYLKPYQMTRMRRMSRTSLPNPMPSIRLVYGSLCRAVKPAATSSEAETAPEQPFFDGGDEVADEFGGRTREIRPLPGLPGQAEREAPALAIDETKPHLVAEARPHDAAQLADAVDQAEAESAPPGEDIAVEQRRLLALELAAPAQADDVLEAAMDVA